MESQKRALFHPKEATGAVYGWCWYCNKCNLQCAVSYEYDKVWDRFIESKISCTLGCRATWRREVD